MADQPSVSQQPLHSDSAAQMGVASETLAADVGVSMHNRLSTLDLQHACVSMGSHVELAVMQVINLLGEQGEAGHLQPARRAGGISMLPLVDSVLQNSEQGLTISELLR